MNAEALELAKGLPASPGNLARVARMTSEADSRAAFLQWELRLRAKERFGDDALSMLWDREGLAMASHPRIAEYHASLFPSGETVLDLTCGLGSDLRALARRGTAIGYELDPGRAESARHNAPGARVIVGDGLAAATEARFAIADPQRREGAHRLDDPNAWSPDPQAVAILMRSMRRGLLKLSPGTPDAYLATLGSRIEFVSAGGECREALVIMGSDPGPEGVWAVHVESGASLPAGPPPPIGSIESFLFDADPAAVRAGALGGLGLTAVGDHPGYLTAEESTPCPWLRTYQVLWTGRESDAYREAEKRGLRVFEIKQRGAGVNVPDWMRRVKKMRGEPASLAFWREGASVRAGLLAPG